ncbi:MAG: DNA polymerase beta protein [Candidatus Saganbacteria bacterium]|uniref:DNA polymerase beta protein n=1 Tax=Candidatus Saganbacteria bacterium TaxID=2575572 RepID=A0A833L1A5_UNCSA|nr:MAG: DNA polymerase beta protein [Candidatus Saganbacteria bacterium]
MDFEKIKHDIANIVKKRMDQKHYKVFIFGSRVNSSSLSRSDIDVGLQGEQKINITVLENIKEDCYNLPILQKIDVVDFRTVSEVFKKVALEKIEVLYEQ